MTLQNDLTIHSKALVMAEMGSEGWAIFRGPTMLFSHLNEEEATRFFQALEDAEDEDSDTLEAGAEIYDRLVRQEIADSERDQVQDDEPYLGWPGNSG